MSDAPTRREVFLETYAGMRFRVRDAKTLHHLDLHQLGLLIGDNAYGDKGNELFHRWPADGMLTYTASMPEIIKFLTDNGFTVVPRPKDPDRRKPVDPKRRPLTI